MTLTDRDRPHIRIIGIGNLDRGDDAIGRHVAQALRKELPTTLSVLESTGEMTDLMEKMAGADLVIFIDACQSGAKAGTIQRFDVSSTPLPATLTSPSTHGFGLNNAIELARTLGELPYRCTLYAIEMDAASFGPGLSSDVQNVLPECIKLIMQDISLESLNKLI